MERASQAGQEATSRKVSARIAPPQPQPTAPHFAAPLGCKSRKQITNKLAGRQTSTEAALGCAAVVRPGEDTGAQHLG